MVGNFVEKLGTTGNDNLIGTDLEILYALAGNDTLSSSVGSLTEGKEVTILVGGSGLDQYQTQNNVTTVIYDNGNSLGDSIIASSIGLNSSSSFIVEIDSRHLYAGDTESDQYVLILDWKQENHKIENFVLEGITVTHDQIANNLNLIPGYLGNFTWEQTAAQDLLDFERAGLNFNSINDSIAEIAQRATALEAPVINQGDLNTPIYRFQNNSVPGTYLYVGEAERQNILTNFTNFVEEGFAFKVGENPEDDLIPLYRFQSLVTPGTYLFVGEEERNSINNSGFAEQFVEEGLAFYVYGADADLGAPFYRFQNSNLPGTYLYAGPEERTNILNNFSNFAEEGAAFRVDI